MNDNSVNFLKFHVKYSFAELLNNLVVDSVEWMQNKDELPRAYLKLKDSNIIALTPYYDEGADYVGALEAQVNPDNDDGYGNPQHDY